MRGWPRHPSQEKQCQTPKKMVRRLCRDPHSLPSVTAAGLLLVPETPSGYSSAYEDDPDDAEYVNEPDVGAQEKKEFDGRRGCSKKKYRSEEVKAMVKRQCKCHGEEVHVDSALPSITRS